MKKMIILGALILFGCGREQVVQQPAGPQPTPTPTVTPTPGEKYTYAEMQTQMNLYCSSCHAAARFMTSEAQLRASQAKDYLWSRRMPPASAPRALPDEVRAKMVGFF